MTVAAESRRARRASRLASLKDRKLLTCREVEFLFRISRAEVADAFRRGKVPGRKDGKSIYISAKYAEALWGPRWARGGAA